jgi:alanine dehydrogenase
MYIGIPKECRAGEHRVGLTPAGVRLLTELGHVCYVERGAGLAAGFSDEAYLNSGGRFVYSGEEVYRRSELILKIARPTRPEIDWLVPEQTLLGFLYLPAAHPDKVQALIDKRITAVAYEQILTLDGQLPVLRPFSQIGGRMAAQMAAHLSQNDSGGRGVLLGGVPGVPPAEVVIIGAGVVGENAARAFLGMGAQVTLLDQDLGRLQQLSSQLNGRVVTLLAHPYNISRVSVFADVIVGAVHVPAERVPIVIPDHVVKSMRPGAILLDLSIDEGGCAETSRPTTHEDPTYIRHGVIHCCIPNLPSVVARTATHAFQNAAWPYIEAIAQHGYLRARDQIPALAPAAAVQLGHIRHLNHPAFTGMRTEFAGAPT